MHFFTHVARRVRTRGRPVNCDHIFERVQAEWKATPRSVMLLLCSSMPRRVQKVIDTNGGPFIIKTGPFCGGTPRLRELDGLYDLACFLQRTYVPFLLIPRHLHIHLPRLYIEKNKVLDLSDQFFWTAVYIKDFIRFWRISSLHPTFLTKIPKYQHSYSVSWYFPPENDIIIII